LLRVLTAVGGVVLLVLVLIDAFETIILPRRISRRYRLTSLFYRFTWRPWRAAANRLPGARREAALSWFGPLSLLVLLVCWALTIVGAFALLHWSDGSAIRITGGTPHFLDDLYLSGTTFFTLGMGDVVPISPVAKIITVIESGLGFAFLAIIIGYLPVIYQTFSRREVAINLLDARAGTPPSASELLRRHGGDPDGTTLTTLMAEWERWSGEVLESHLSYPVLAYFRSQHSNESWLAALTTILDTSALVMVSVDGWCMHQAQMTFAMARHAVVDLAQVFSAPRPARPENRLNDHEFAQLIECMQDGARTLDTVAARQRLNELRAMYEPYVTALANHLALNLPPWVRRSDHPDNWEAAPWKDIPTPSEAADQIDDHF
jgi:hypothetical protein